MTIVRCTKCGKIINTSDNVNKMLNLISNNSNVVFHPTYFNKCPICGNTEVEILSTIKDTSQSTIYSTYKLTCLECNHIQNYYYTPIKHSIEGQNPFYKIKCPICGGKECIIEEQEYEFYSGETLWKTKRIVNIVR